MVRRIWIDSRSNLETRSFTIDYLRLQRKGLGQNSATLAAGTSGGGTTIAGGGSAGGAGGRSVFREARAARGSTAVGPPRIDQLWTELRDDISRLLTPRAGMPS